MLGFSDIMHAGVFGNSLTSALPTWAVYADNLTDTSTAGVITDSTVLPTVDDFKYSASPDNRWHQHVLTYNGQNAPLPTLQYFVDGTEMVGNSRLEIGNNGAAGIQLLFHCDSICRSTPIRLQFDRATTTRRPRSTQPSIPPGSVNEHQLRLGRQRQVAHSDCG